MDRTRLMEVLNQSTCLISKGETTQRKMPEIPILLWNLLLASNDPDAAKLEQVDCHFIIVGVNAQQAQRTKQAFIELLESYPDISSRRLSDGPSYKSVASVVGDDLTALRLFGLGKVLGLWDVLLPSQFDIPDELVDEAVDLGLIVTTGYQSQHVQPALVAVG